jgi:hypothetical protein
VASDSGVVGTDEGEVERWRGGLREKEKWKTSLLC